MALTLLFGRKTELWCQRALHLGPHVLLISGITFICHYVHWVTLHMTRSDACRRLCVLCFALSSAQAGMACGSWRSCGLFCLGWSQLFFQGASVLISWLQLPPAVVLEPKKIKSVIVSIVSPSICHEVMGQDAMIFTFWMLNFKPSFSTLLFHLLQKLSNSSSLSVIRVVSSAYLRLLVFLPAILIPACAHPAWHFAWYTLHIS